MSKIQGLVFKVYDKPFSGRMTHTIKLDGDPIWYRAGGNRFAGIAEPGNTVTFEATPNPDGTSAKIVGPVTIVATQPVAASGTPAYSGSGGDRNASIVYQSSRKDAVAFLAAALAAGAIKLPAAQAAKLGALEAALDRYTAIFYEDVGTLGAVVREAEAGGEGTAAAEPAEADDGE